MQFVKNNLEGEVGAPVSAANNTSQWSDVLDMSGFEGVSFRVAVLDCTSGGVATLTIKQCTQNSTTGMTTTGIAATFTSTAGDDMNNKLLIADCYRPTKRYVAALLESATQNVQFGSTIAIRYGAHKKPITDDSTVLNVASGVGP